MLAADTRFGSHRLFLTRNGKYAGTVLVLMTLVWLVALAPDRSAIRGARDTSAVVALPLGHVPDSENEESTASSSNDTAVMSSGDLPPLYRTPDGEPVLVAVMKDVACRGSPTRLRIMPIGDSITSGLARKSERRIKVRSGHPREGTCSYRGSLFAELLNATATSVSIEAVGPFDEAHGGPTPSWCWDEAAKRSGLAAGKVAREWSANAATWGVRASQVNHGDSELRRRNAKAAQRLPRYTYNASRVSDTSVWVSRWAPDLVTVLIGTNDFIDSSPTQIVNRHLATLLADIFDAADRRNDGSSVPAKCDCKVRVALSLLLPRHDNPNDVRTVNTELLRRVGDCRQDAQRMAQTVNETTGRWREDASQVWCHPCLVIVDGSGTAFPGASPHQRRFSVERHTYDGLHPSHDGETVVGRNLAALMT